MWLQLTEYASGILGRDRLEQFISARFSRVHGAEIEQFMPNLLGLEDDQGVPRGALGYRGAAVEPLYLERYLDCPIEEAIGRGVLRQQVVEVGNLAGTGCRATLYLARRLPRLLLDRGFEWITFTATRQVRDMLQQFGAPLLDLGAADPKRLGQDSQQWGSYYRNEPRVMAGWLPAGPELFK
jgi:hypothetical protein